MSTEPSLKRSRVWGRELWGRHGVVKQSVPGSGESCKGGLLRGSDNSMLRPEGRRSGSKNECPPR